MGYLTALIVGEISEDEPMKGLMTTFKANILEFESALLAAIETATMPSNMILFGAYSCRTLLESTMTALIARVDPLRVLFLQQHQSSDHYDRSKKNSSAIKWSGDILSTENRTSDIWAIDIEKVNSWRALLGNWQQKIILAPSLTTLVDDNSEVNSEWLENLKRIEPHQIGERFQGDAGRLYSELSKAVHAEYVIPRAIVLDENTIRDYILKTFQIIAQIALLSHFSPIFHGSLSRESAFELFKKIEESVNVTNN